MTKTLNDLVKARDEAAVVSRLVDAGARFTDEDLVTALSLASSRGLCRVIALLCDRVASIDQPAPIEGMGWNALFWAIHGNQAEAVRLLLSRGANPNASDPARYSPLFNAIGIEVDHAQDQDREPTIELTDALLSRGADVNAANNRGETPLDLAIVRGHPAAEQLLRARGAVRGTLRR